MEVAVQTYWESTQQTAVVTGAAHPAGIGFGIAGSACFMRYGCRHHGSPFNASW